MVAKRIHAPRQIQVLFGRGSQESCWADGPTVLRCSVVSQAPGSQLTLTLLCVCLASTVEHACYDPKDSELCLARVKPQETGVEARRTI